MASDENSNESRKWMAFTENHTLPLQSPKVPERLTKGLKSCYTGLSLSTCFSPPDLWLLQSPMNGWLGSGQSATCSSAFARANCQVLHDSVEMSGLNYRFPTVTNLVVRFTNNVVVTLAFGVRQPKLLKSAATHVLANPASLVE